jgi:hypothetical protein
MVMGNQVDFKEIFGRIDRAPNLPVNHADWNDKVTLTVVAITGRENLIDV